MAGRRQVLSYSDSLAAPSGDVDFEQPLPSLAPTPFDSSRDPIAGPSSSKSQSSADRDRRRYEREVLQQPPANHAPPPPTSAMPMPHISHPDAIWGPPRDPPAYGGPLHSGPFHPTHPISHQNRPPLPYTYSPFVPPAGPSRPIPYYTGPPPGFGPPPSHIPDERYAAPKPRPPPIAPAPLPTGPRAERIALNQQHHASFGPQSASFLASPMAYHDTITRSAPFSQVHYSNQQSFEWPGSNYYERTKVVIEDWDVSSDEDDDDEEPEEGDHRDEASARSSCQMTARERRSLARDTRLRHTQHVQELFEKANGRPAVTTTTTTTTPPIQEGTASSDQPSSASAEQAAKVAKENTLLEKKQLEIKAMMERIKKLEAGRSGKSKAAPAATPAVIPTPAPADSPQIDGSRGNSKDVQESPPMSKTTLTIDPGLAEQRRKLLEAMNARSKKLASVCNSAGTSANTSTSSTPGDSTPTGLSFILDTTPSTSPATCTSKRKADDTEADDVADTIESAGVMQDENTSVSADLTGRKAKRQRKKERRRAEARARAELDGKLQSGDPAVQKASSSGASGYLQTDERVVSLNHTLLFCFPSSEPIAEVR